jgi:hypothetical protein
MLGLEQIRDARSGSSSVEMSFLQMETGDPFNFLCCLSFADMQPVPPCRRPTDEAPSEDSSAGVADGKLPDFFREFWAFADFKQRSAIGGHPDCQSDARPSSPRPDPVLTAGRTLQRL